MILNCNLHFSILYISYDTGWFLHIMQTLLSLIKYPLYTFLHKREMLDQSYFHN